MRKVGISVTLEPVLIERLDEIADNMRMSRSALLNLISKAYADTYENKDLDEHERKINHRNEPMDDEKRKAVMLKVIKENNGKMTVNELMQYMHDEYDNRDWKAMFLTCMNTAECRTGNGVVWFTPPEKLDIQQKMLTRSFQPSDFF